MGKFIKHNSNYIRTTRHQFLKGGSTIFERDWVTVGSQLNFGPGKIPYYNNGNFIFTTSPIPNYQKKYKNGVTVGMWTYEDVKNASDVVNKVNFDEYTEDIRTYAYYGSCLELVKVSIENIIRTFPGNITVSDDEIGFKKRIESFDTNSCSQSLAENYVPVTGESTGYYYLNNPFDININLKDVQLSYYDNPLHYLHHSFKDYKVSYDNGENWEDIEEYKIVSRTLYEKIPDDAPCVQTVKSRYNSVSFQKLYKATWKRSVDGEVLHEEYYENGTATNWNTPGALWDRVDGDDRVEVNMPYTVRQDVVFVLREGCEVENVDIEIVTSKTFRKRITLKKGKYFITYNNVKDGWQSICYTQGETPKFEISNNANYVKYVSNGSNGTLYAVTSQGDVRIRDVSNERISVVFYSVETIYHTYKSYQMFSEDEVPQGWVRSTCPLDFWFPKTSGQNTTNAETNFLNLCDNKNHQVLPYSYLDTGINNPVYTITINGTHKIEGYIYNKQVIPLTKDRNLIIQPKEDVIEEYFDGLEGFEKLLLTRKTKPLYLNKFVTPIEYNSDYVYYKRSYTWPSNGYCIDITSPRYFDFINKLSNMAQLFDELWTDNLWRRMTHEAIKNYDWTYTREFKEGDEVDNVDGGERMHKVINIIGRIFDDIKRTIDTIKKNNRVTYNGDRNIPNALLSDKLELNGWDIYSTIWSYPEEIEEENSGESEEETEEETQTRMVSASEQTITREFLDEYITKKMGAEDIPTWYPTLDPTKMTFADVDNDFMRKLLLSSRRIFETKGTRHSIDMIMGMFGYGNMDEDHPNYIIKETYRTVTPKEYGEEETGFGDTIVRLNAAKKNELLYDEDASGIPVGSFAIFEKNTETGKQEPTTYLIPFYDQRKIYDGNLYFQTKGGWCYHKDGEETEIDMSKWTETLSYLHVTSQISDLLSVHPNSVKNGDIYYVVNVNDYIEYAENAEDTLYSHFFVLEDDYNPESFSSWTNINLDEEFYEESADFSEEEVAKYTEYSKKANYLDSIVPYNIGNNPHVGYGKYDMGEEFFEYMKQPFKYSFDGHNNFETIEELQEAEGISFDVSVEKKTDNISDKIQIIDGVENVNNDLNVLTVPSYGGKKDLKYKEYKLEKIKDLIKTKYYLNSKVIYLENKIENNEYKKYFLNVIIKYLMQIIPSTAIFVLENFAPSDGGGDDTPKKYRVHFYDTDGTTQIHSEKVEEGKSVACYGGNDYYVRGDASRTKVSCPYGPINSEIFLVKWSEPIVYYNVHFLDSNGTTELYTQSVEKGKSVACYGGNDYYVRGDASRTKVSCPYGPTKFVRLKQFTVRWDKQGEIIEPTEYNVTFYDKDGTTLLSNQIVQANAVVYNYQHNLYYRKNDETHTVVGFPVRVTQDEEFVKFVHYMVSFFDSEDSPVPIDVQYIEDGHQITPKDQFASYKWYKKGDTTKTTVTFPYTVTSTTTFIKKEDYIFEFEDGTTTKNVETLYYSNSIQVNVVSKLGNIAQEFTEEHYDLSPEGDWVTTVSVSQQYNYVKPFFTINYKTVNPQNRTFKVRLTQQGSGKTLLLNVTQKAPDIGLIYNMPPIQLGDTFISPFSVDSVSVYEEGTQVLVGYGTAGRREGRLSEASFEKYLCATVTVQNGYKVVPNNTDRIIYVDAGTPSGVAHFPFKVSADGKTLTALTPSDYSGEYYTYYRGFIDGFGITNGTVEPI